jgi:hypothetical protein
MLILLGFIHACFAVIFGMFQQWWSLGAIIVCFCIVIFRYLPPFGEEKTLARPSLETQVDVFRRMLYLSATVLFYVALTGVSLGISRSF